MNVSEITDLVLPEAPGIFVRTVDDMVMRATREFCEETYSLVERVTVYFPAGKDAGEVEADSFDMEPLSVLSVVDSPSSYCQVSFGEIRLQRPVKEAKRLVMDVAVRPKLGAKDIPDSLRPYLDAIRCGALAHCLVMPYEWADQNRAMYYKQQFQSYIHDAKQRNANGYHAGNRQSRGKQWL